MIFLKKIHGNIILSLNVLKRWLFQKNSTGVWSILSYFLKRWYFFSPKMWSYSLDGKWKMIFLQKNTWKYDISFKCPEKTVFQKNCSGIWSFLYYLKRWVFSPENMILFLWTKNERWSFSRNTWAYDIFCIYVWMLQTWYYPSAKKKKKKKKSAMILSRKKIHLRVIDILDHILVISYPQFLSIQMRYPSPRDPLFNPSS